MRSYIEDIMQDRRKGLATLPIRLVLRILSIVYHLVTSSRNLLYDKRIIKAMDVPCRVISIGNLTLGGTGKTPVVIMTVRLLKEAGYSVAVVSRGYRRKGKEPLVVSDGETVKVSPRESGDEPHIIASSVTGVPVVVGADRYKAAKLACERFGPDVIVLDDAFQHRQLYRNVDVVTLDAENSYGNECLLPRGILRESPRALRRAKAAVITRFHEGIRRDSLERMVQYYSRKTPIFFCKHVPLGLRELEGADNINLDSIRGVRVAALSNIAYPESFYRLLASLGTDIFVKHVMEDHHRYTIRELERIERESMDTGADFLVMTAKDERNLPEGYQFKMLRALVLDIETQLVENIDEYMKIIAPKRKV